MISRDAVRRLVLQKAVLDELTEIDRNDRKAAHEHMEPGDRIKAPDGLGEINLTDPKGTYVVTDPAAFFHWVKTHAPHGLRESVDPGYQRAILATGCDRNGEVPDGIEFVVGRPVLAVKPSTEARQIATASVAALGAERPSLLELLASREAPDA